MKNGFVLLALLFSSVLCAQDIKLLAPLSDGGQPLMEILNERQSSRDYSSKELSQQQLSNLLWAAWGFNRGEQKKHTAPSSMNHQEIQIYVTLASGFYLYDPKINVLLHKGNADIRALTGEQDFVEQAPLNLVYVANYADNDKIDEETWLHYSYANVGFIAQNVYLYCASEGLGTVVRGWVDKEKLEAALSLPEENVVILCQTVGVIE